MIELDERIAAGMREQLAARDALLRAGGRQLGWKVGFGAPAAAAKLGIDRPLVGFLPESGRLPDGAAVDVSSWSAPALEGEIAVRMAADVMSGATWHEVRAAIGGVAVAIELADVDPPPEDVQAVVAGNIFHRHVMLGPVDSGRTSGEGITARIERDGEEVAATDDPAAMTGEIVEVVRLTAELLDACGEKLRAGEVVITGSVVPPMAIEPGHRYGVELPPLGRLEVRT